MTGTPPGYTGICCYYYDVNAVSNALQWYTFTGTQPQTFTIAYTIDAILTAFDDPNDPYDYSIFAGASGGISIFDGIVDPDLALELPLGTNLDLSQVFLDGTMAGSGGGGSVAGGGSVTFTLNPGSGFFLSSFLSASVPQQVPGWVSADASHTMNMRFTQGDTRLLQASLPGLPTSSVPEPSSWALFALGLTGMAVMARRRGRRA
jgi:hypothetical protein